MVTVASVVAAVPIRISRGRFAEHPAVGPWSVCRGDDSQRTEANSCNRQDAGGAKFIPLSYTNSDSPCCVILRLFVL